MPLLKIRNLGVFEEDFMFFQELFYSEAFYSLILPPILTTLNLTIPKPYQYEKKQTFPVSHDHLYNRVM